MNYLALHAKMRAMGARLLRPEDYRQLCSLHGPEALRAQLAGRSTPEEEWARVLRFVGAGRRALQAVALSPGQAPDLHYYLRAWDAVRALPGPNRAAISHILGSEIDLRNIQWVQRLKQHGLPPEALYPHLIPLHYRLRREDLRRWVEADASQAAPCAPDMPQVLATAVKRWPRSVAVALRYFWHKQQEAQNLTAIAEGLRHGLSPEEILTHLRG